jgi:hypothetical protein
MPLVTVSASRQLVVRFGFSCKFVLVANIPLWLMRRTEYATQNSLGSFGLRQSRGSKPDDNYVVTREHKVDQNDLKKARQNI